MKRNILINDGISDSGKKKLIEYKFNIIDKHIEQENLIDFINQNNIHAVLVRSATEIQKNVIDACPSLQLIGRGGVGMDNIDVEYAKKKSIHIINTPSASSLSVAELVFAHLFSMTRFLHQSNRTMPLEGDMNFKALKHQYSRGLELKGKTLGIIGFGKIGQEVAKIGIGIGMEVKFHDPFIQQKKIKLILQKNKGIEFNLNSIPKKQIIEKSDIITLHIPKQNTPIIKKSDLNQMKKGAFVINTSRGGLISEKDLLNALNEGKIQCVALDVFEGEPKPKIETLMHNNISLSPHIGASTLEAQERIGLELAEQIKEIFNG